jgi:Rhodopirellula transposase DDE domain
MALVDEVRIRYRLLKPAMTERMERLWAAAEAKSLGFGGGAIVTAATGIRSKRLWLGKRELEEMAATPPAEPPREQRIRRSGGGRKRLTEIDPTLQSDLDALVEPTTRGDPECALRWTTKSKEKLAAELRARGHQVSPTTVGVLLRDADYSLQAVQKEKEGSQHPDRNAQFEHIHEQVKAFQAAGQPVVSVDAKKKELVGDFKNAGKEWQPKGQPELVRTHDFPDPRLGKVAPYGVYDPTRNEAWVSVGIDHDTAEFAVNSLLAWWRSMGKRSYGNATELLVTADGGGSNASRSHLWKAEVQRFADTTGLAVTVSHFPPGTSKWNKIEHRLFSQITQNWRGRPLVSHDTVVNLIANTRTETGLRVRAKLDTRAYETGKKVAKETMRALAIERAAFHGEWNYTILPRTQ